MGVAVAGYFSPSGREVAEPDARQQGVQDLSSGGSRDEPLRCAASREPGVAIRSGRPDASSDSSTAVPRRRVSASLRFANEGYEFCEKFSCRTRVCQRCVPFPWGQVNTEIRESA